jgi:hypothetical protein
MDIQGIIERLQAVGGAKFDCQELFKELKTTQIALKKSIREMSA